MEQEKIDKINTLIEDNKEKWANLNCDCTTRILNYLLTENNIEHRIMAGSGSFRKYKVGLHYWIEIEDMKLDVKAKEFFGPSASEGLFIKSTVKYIGTPIKMLTSTFVYNTILNRYK